MASALIGALVTFNVDEIKVWFSEQEPLLAQFSAVEKPAFNGFMLVAADASRVPAGTGDSTDCDELWRQGMQAGALPVDERIQRLLLRGDAKNGVTLTGLRARVTSRGPGEGDAALWCPGAGTLDPVGFAFDLWSQPGDPVVDVADAARHSTDPEKPTAPVTQFDDGFAIALKENETIPLVFQTRLPQDRITWYVEADVLVGDTMRTVRIDDGGQDFYSPGTRTDVNGYDRGHLAGVEYTDWGVDVGGVVHDGPSGRAVEYAGLRIPVPAGDVDVYHPNDGSVAPSGYRAVRVDGEIVARFNPSGVAPESAPAVGDRCGPAGAGSIRSVSPVATPGDALVERTGYDVTCSEGPSLRYEQSRPVGTDTMMTAILTPADDPQVAARMLGGLRHTSPPAPATAPTVEPVQALTEFPPTRDAVDTPTDVVYLTETFVDSRGTVLRFDKVDYRGGSVINENSRTRTVVDTSGRWGGEVERFRKEHTLVVLSRSPDGQVLGLSPVT